MFKKTLIAAALMSVASMAQAVEITPTVAKYGVEGYNAQATAAKLVPIVATFKPGVPYVENDIISVTVAGVDSIVAATAGVPALTGTVGASFIKFEGNVAIFRVNTGGIAAEAPLVLTNVSAKLLTAKNGTAITVSSEATSTNTTVGKYDGAVEPIKVATFVTQHSAEVAPKFSGVINVEEGRQQFVTTPTADELIVKLNVDAGAVTNSVAVAKDDTITYKLTGEDFSYLMDFDTSPKDGELKSNELLTAFGVKSATKGDASNIEASIDGNTVTFIETVDTGGLANGDELTITANNKGVAGKGSILTTQKFKLDVDYATVAAPKALSVLAKADAGEWTLNGAVIPVSFVPFSADYSIIATVSNTSATKADIEVVVYAENGGVTSHKLATKAAAKGLTNITAELNKLGIKGNVAMDIVVAAPENSVEASVIYYHKASQDRIKTK